MGGQASKMETSNYIYGLRIEDGGSTNIKARLTVDTHVHFLTFYHGLMKMH